MSAPELLVQKADEWKAVGEEQTDENDAMRLIYVAIETSLREVALALELEREEAL